VPKSNFFWGGWELGGLISLNMLGRDVGGGRGEVSM
jgi:hypothetical protein